MCAQWKVEGGELPALYRASQPAAEISEQPKDGGKNGDRTQDLSTRFTMFGPDEHSNGCWSCGGHAVGKPFDLFGWYSTGLGSPLWSPPSCA